MTIDSSALVAILCREPERDRLIRSMAAAPRRRLSVASFLETGIFCIDFSANRPERG